MRRTNSLLVILALFAAGTIVTIDAKATRAQDDSPTQGPEVTGVRKKNKKLWVVGKNFNEGAMILINGAPVATRNDEDDPSGLLFAKKGGKKIPADSTALVSVQNAGGVTSTAFDFFSGLTITLDDVRKTIHLAVGDKFLVLLKKETYEWLVTDFDDTVISKAPDEAPQGSQGVFQAVKAGSTQLRAIGEVPCSKSTPPCLAPALSFEVTLVIE